MLELFIRLVHLTVVALQEFVPYPELFVFPYLTSLGWLPYSGIIDQHFPGLLFLPVNLFSLGLRTPQSLQLFLLAAVFVQSLFLGRIAARILPGSKIWIVAAYALWQPLLAGSHLWLDTFVPLATVPALYFLLSGRLVVSGLLLGVAVVLKQTALLLIPAVLLHLYISKNQSLTSTARFLAACALAPLVVVAYLAGRGVFAQFWDWAVVFNIAEYPFRAAIAPQRSFIVAALIISLYALASLVAVRRLRGVKLIAAWVVLSVAGGLTRPDLVHLHTAVPFLSLLTGLALFRTWRLSRLLCVLVILPVVVFAGRNYLLRTTWGGVRFFDSHTLAAAGSIRARTTPGEKIFILGAQPHLYPLTRTQPAGNIFVYQLPWYLNRVEAAVADGLKNDPPWLIVFDPRAGIDGRPISSYAPSLLEFLNTHYRLTEEVGLVQIYELNSFSRN